MMEAGSKTGANYKSIFKRSAHGTHGENRALSGVSERLTASNSHVGAMESVVPAIPPHKVPFDAAEGNQISRRALQPLANDNKANIQKPITQKAVPEVAKIPKLASPSGTEALLRRHLKARRNETVDHAVTRNMERLSLAMSPWRWKKLASSDSFLSEREQQAIVARRANAILCALEALENAGPNGYSTMSWHQCWELAAKNCWGSCVGGDVSPVLIHKWFQEIRDTGKFQLPTMSSFWKMSRTRHHFRATGNDDVLVLIEAYKKKIELALRTKSYGKLLPTRKELAPLEVRGLGVKAAVVYTLLLLVPPLFPRKNWMLLCREVATRLKYDGWSERAHPMTANLYFR